MDGRDMKILDMVKKCNVCDVSGSSIEYMGDVCKRCEERRDYNYKLMDKYIMEMCGLVWWKRVIYNWYDRMFCDLYYGEYDYDYVGLFVGNVIWEIWGKMNWKVLNMIWKGIEMVMNDEDKKWIDEKNDRVML